jgi:hypothetical protein
MSYQQRACSLPEQLERLCHSYALAATATGVSVLSLLTVAEAKVIYTPSNIPITENGGLIPLDLNHDGLAEFQFSNFSYSTHGNGNFWLKIMPEASNEVWSYQSKGHLCAAALPPGKTVGPKGKFQKDPFGGLFLANAGNGTQGGTYFGPWTKVESAYVGLKFLIHGKFHYGWARVKFPAPGDWRDPTLSGYAYESVPNKAIKTAQKEGQLSDRGVRQTQSVPRESGTLGVLAQGASEVGPEKSK